ncbi:Xaa-Pro dipeptidase [Pseudoxanthomonas broegbernensis]|uniref:Xaa-Pro dipeptidase n=1 Tax=Pseudoxanthomonas broegbernensis TaxID=83619 RepID=A0A7V8K6V1_9GAMM|nr:Xaa-Pro dipeptidase [Pseudoxanthomonas broegbernensis]KAF1686111.1 Xaa-Pro dipeptidase [Pseudoxanthomonas broegbernensis]MBB6063806.1 Xaa-Pro dipeptidase [Pseudoxanthomonas broegbernensis]
MNDTDPALLYPRHLAVLRARADEALARSGHDHLLIPSGRRHYQAFDDRDYPFAVNPHFKHWLPLTAVADSWLAYTPGQRPKVIYLQPRDYWHVVPDAPGGWWVEHVDVHVVRTPEEALPLLPGPAARCAILGEANSALGDYAPNNPAPALDYLHYQRSFKTPYELALMRMAQHRAARAHVAAEAAFRAGASEFEIHMAYCAAARQDATEVPYQNIVALNEHGAVLHYTELDRAPPTEPRSFLIDAGASHCGYAADITRTHASDHGGEFQAMIEAVDAAQQAMCAAVRAGADYRQLHLDAHLALMGVLREFGVLKASPEAALATGVSAAFFPHGLGHPIGLQVHDVAGLAASDRGGSIPRPEGHPYLRMTRVLEPGMVVTIEPGIYFIDMLLDELKGDGRADSVDWARVEAFRPYGGIRIEDDVACTEDAPENLTRPAFAA